jgi:type II secretory pathway component PulM
MTEGDDQDKAQKKAQQRSKTILIWLVILGIVLFIYVFILKPELDRQRAVAAIQGMMRSIVPAETTRR